MGRRERVNWIPESTRSILNPSCHHMRACCPEDRNVQKTKTKPGRQTRGQVCYSVFLRSRTERTLLLPRKISSASSPHFLSLDISFRGGTARDKQGFPRLAGGRPGGGGRGISSPSGPHPGGLRCSLSLSVLTKRLFSSLKTKQNKTHEGRALVWPRRRWL